MKTLLDAIVSHWIIINMLGIPVLVGLMFVTRFFARRNVLDALYERRALPSEYDPPLHFRPAYLIYVPGGVNYGHVMGATIIDLVLRGVIAAKGEGEVIIMSKGETEKMQSVLLYEKNILDGMFHSREEFRFPADTSDAFDRAYDANFGGHVEEAYFAEALGLGGVAALRREEKKLLGYLALLAVVGILVWFGLFFLEPFAFVLGIALPYIGYQLLTIRMKSTSEYYRNYLDLLANISGYQTFLFSVASDKSDVTTVGDWNKHTPYLVAFGLGFGLSDEFRKSAFTPVRDPK